MKLGFKLGLDFYLGGALHAVLKPFVMALGLVLRRNHDLDRCHDVTLLKLMGGGSLVIAYPALLAFKTAPHVRRLRLVTSPAVLPFAQLLGVFDEILVIDDRSISRLLRTSLRVCLRLFRTGALVDLEVHSRLTTVFCLLTCARNRIGFYTAKSFWRKGLSTHLLFCNLSRGIHHFYDQLAQLFGGVVPSFDECIARFRSQFCEYSRAGVSERQIGVAPCCSNLAPERMLTTAEWTGLLEDVQRRSTVPVRFHFFGGPAERTHIREVVDALSSRVPGAACEIHAGGLSIRGSVERLGWLDEFWCIDSGLLHCARLMGIPTVSFWGPSDPQVLLRPGVMNRDVVHYARLACSPCVHLSAERPCGGNNICMRAAVNESGAAYLNPIWMLAQRLSSAVQPASLPAAKIEP